MASLTRVRGEKRAVRRAGEAGKRTEYLAFVRYRPGEARALVATPVSQRMPRYRLLARAGRLVVAALTRWGVSVSTRAAHPDVPAIRSTRPLPAT